MKKARFVALAAVVITVAVAGLAFAFWTQGGTGSGDATAGTTSAITVNQTTSVTGLYPGGPPVTLTGTFDNPNVHPVHISSVTVAVHALNVQSDGAKPACTAADFSVAGSTGPIVVPVGNDAGSWTGLTVRLVDGVANQDNCKNVNITLDYTANP